MATFSSMIGTFHNFHGASSSVKTIATTKLPMYLSICGIEKVNVC